MINIKQALRQAGVPSQKFADLDNTVQAAALVARRAGK